MTRYYTSFGFATSMVAVLLSLHSIGYAEIPIEIESEILRVVSVQSTDREYWAMASGDGIAEYVRSDAEEHATWDFRFRQRSRDLWIEYSIRSAESNLSSDRVFDTIRLLCDGKVYVTALFSPRINPGGCKMIVTNEEADNFAIASIGHRIDPRAYLLPPVLREGDLELYRSPQVKVSIEEASVEESLIRIAFESGAFWKVRKRGDIGDRIIKAELGAESDNGMPMVILDYRWERNNEGMFCPAEIVLRRLDKSTVNLYHNYRMTFTRLKNRFIDGHEFSISSLEMCERAWMADNRPGQDIKVRDVRPNEAQKLEQNGDLQAIVETFPERGGKSKAEAVDVAKSSNDGSLLRIVIANVIVVCVLFCGWLWRRNRARSA